MKITNPTDNEISMQYRGVVYKIPAGATVAGFAADVAEYWKTMIHQFVLVSDEDVEVAEPKVEAPVEVAPVAEVDESADVAVEAPEVAEAPVEEEPIVSKVARKITGAKK